MIVEPTEENIERAAQLLRDGELVVFPTETVYGLGAHALDETAVAKIFAAKGRPSYNPLIVHVADVEAVGKIVASWPQTAARLAEHFWPGPLTLVLPKLPVVPGNVTAGLDSVAVRVPSHPIAQALLIAANIPVAAPSANRFTHISPTRAEHVQKSLGDRVPLILGGGDTPVGIESTVLSLVEDMPVLLRPGAVSREQIEKLIGPISVAKVLSGESSRPSPGMMERHYSPSAHTLRFESVEIELAREIVASLNGRNMGALLLPGSTLAVDFVVPMPLDAAAYARKLYAALHELEDAGCSHILLEMPPDDSAWQVVRDRLSRASVPLQK